MYYMQIHCVTCTNLLTYSVLFAPSSLHIYPLEIHPFFGQCVCIFIPSFASVSALSQVYPYTSSSFLMMFLELIFGRPRFRCPSIVQNIAPLVMSYWSLRKLYCVTMYIFFFLMSIMISFYWNFSYSSLLDNFCDRWIVIMTLDQTYKYVNDDSKFLFQVNPEKLALTYSRTDLT